MAWLWNNLDLVLGLTLDHIRLSAIPILLGFAASLPLGWAATRVRWLRGILLTVFNVVYTIPALALFVVLPGLLGTKVLDEINVLVAMTLYATAMMLRGTLDAFGSVSPDVLQSATAQGYSSTSRFWTVQLPLAGPVLLANLRVVSVSTVSLLSVAALVGSGGLGRLFTAGYARSFIDEIVVGIVFIMLLALAFDALLVLAGRVLLPWSARAKAPTRIPFMKGGAA
ncbi:ABC transporter permease [Pseudolysinimonas sp.]|jgi:osmoprotectant transport system permease protein|uniref:ABC transporter permease n=1 Tax=Pseudolysinimonas sp. TaxID=2680009 RepID=UPI00378470FC